MNPLEIHQPAPTIQHRVDSPVSESGCRRQTFDLPDQGGSSDRCLRSYLKVDRDRPISYTGANLTITPYTLDVTAAAKTKVYGASDRR